ncbi:MAG TPA: HU family DNA-binding protein [Actinobacteria bacterium]|nr:HU family DNA-binding protein [Actinomycetota bacterium]
MNKAELVEAIGGKTDFSKKDVAAMVDAFQEVVTEVLVKGEKVALIGFGTFQTAKRSARAGINPKTGEKIQISARTVPKFVFGKALKDKVR